MCEIGFSQSKYENSFHNIPAALTILAQKQQDIWLQFDPQTFLSCLPYFFILGNVCW